MKSANERIKEALEYIFDIEDDDVIDKIKSILSPTYYLHIKPKGSKKWFLLYSIDDEEKMTDIEMNLHAGSRTFEYMINNEESYNG